MKAIKHNTLLKTTIILCWSNYASRKRSFLGGRGISKLLYRKCLQYSNYKIAKQKSYRQQNEILSFCSPIPYYNEVIMKNKITCYGFYFNFIIYVNKEVVSKSMEINVEISSAATSLKFPGVYFCICVMPNNSLKILTKYFLNNI